MLHPVSKYLIFATVGATLLIQAMSNNMISVAFPDLTSSLHVSIVAAAWVVTVFQLAATITIPLVGKASDTLGRKRTFMFVVLLFTVGSVLCAMAPNIYWLILFRAIQGMGVGGFVTSAAGIVADTFPESRQRSIGLISSILTGGAVLGPNVGGWLTQYYGWRSLFVFAIPFGMTALVAGAILLKQDKAAGEIHLDIRGAGLGAASLAAFILGLTTLGSSRTSWIMAVTMLLLGATLMYVFLRHERASPNPVIDMEVLRGRPFVAANVFNTVWGFFMGVMTFAPLYAVTIYGASTLQSGLFMTPRTAGMFAASTFSSFFLVRWGYRKPMLISVVLMVVSVFLLGFEFNGFTAPGIAIGGTMVMLTLLALSGIGQGLGAPASNNACIELMPDRVATITAARQTFRNLGQALGVAVSSMALASFGNLGRGFEVVLFGTAVLSLVAIPSVFAMPRSPSDRPQGRPAISRM